MSQHAFGCCSPGRRCHHGRAKNIHQVGVFLYWLCESVTRNVRLGTPRNMQSLDLSKSRLHAEQSCWANAHTTAINRVIGFHAAKRTTIFYAQQKTYCRISNIMKERPAVYKSGLLYAKSSRNEPSPIRLSSRSKDRVISYHIIIYTHIWVCKA
jgi:hypothetical protein